VNLAALYVEPSGVYANRPNVDPWPEARDARKYPGPYPVVAHPPCARWAYTLAPLNQKRYGLKIGDDHGTFEAALESVLKWGGVLEHPAMSLAFAHYNIPRPARGSWQQVAGNSARVVWVTEVSQVAYGHRARKRTWLLYCGVRAPFDLDWSEPPHTARVSQDFSSMRGVKSAKSMSKKEALATPPAFADVLERLALWSTP
jgi:hypothetical protein